MVKFSANGEVLNVSDPIFTLTCMRYIELNPVRADMVERLEDYRWSSYRANAHGAKDDLLTPHAEYQALGTTLEQKQEAYRALSVATRRTLTAVRTALNSELITGAGRFQADIEAMLGRRVQPGQRGRPRKQIETAHLSKEKNNEPRFLVEGFN